MKSALKLRSLVGPKFLLSNTWKHVRGSRGSSARHCSLSSQVDGLIPVFALNADAMINIEACVDVVAQYSPVDNMREL